jgi:hypothetical protein
MIKRKILVIISLISLVLPQILTAGQVFSDALGPHTVTFIVNGSTYAPDGIVNQTTPEGKAVLPAPPTNQIPSGKVSFRGWSTSNPADYQANELWDFNTVVTSDLTLYAVFSDKYLVSYTDKDNKVIQTFEVTSDTSAPLASRTVPEIDWVIFENDIAEKMPNNMNTRFDFWYLDTDTGENKTQIYPGGLSSLETWCCGQLLRIPA